MTAAATAEPMRRRALRWGAHLTGLLLLGWFLRGVSWGELGLDNHYAEPAADVIAVVGLFRSTFAGDESGADGGQGGVRQGADNDKPACFRLAGFSDAEEILALVDALFSRETHGSGVPERQGISGAPTLSRRSTLSLPCCVM